MRTRKLLYMGCLMAASLLTFSSCGDFLDEEPKGQLTPDNFFNSEDDLTASVNALYDRVNQTQSWTNPMYPQWQGDDITANPGSNKQACAALDAFASDGANKGVTDAWNQHYSVIKAANLITESASKAPVAQDKIDVALGNAHFWRAYAYYYLVRVFGPVPLITGTDVSQLEVAPSSVKDVYELIVSDLKAAVNELPTKYEKEPSRLFGVDVWTTKQAAQATLSAVYMSMAGYPLNMGTEYYKLAAEQAKSVIDNNGSYGFILNPEWKDVYSMGNNYNMETVLGINNDARGWWDHDSELSSCCRFEGLGDGGWGDAWGEIAFWKRFPEGARKDAIYAPKVTFQDGNKITKAVDWWALKEDGKTPEVEAYHPMFCIFTVNCDENGNMLRQAYDYLAPNWGGMVNDRRHNLIRYSEILLWYAESAARSGGDLNKAKECLRQVRSRAVNDVENVTLSNGTTVKIADMNAEQLAEACYIEHGWEVAGNWVSMVTRRSDELRMDELKKNFDYRVTNAPLFIAKDAKGKDITAKEQVTVSGSWSEDKIYCPYPTSDVEKNPNLKR